LQKLFAKIIQFQNMTTQHDVVIPLCATVLMQALRAAKDLLHNKKAAESGL
jgi:hypothetical protein